MNKLLLLIIGLLLAATIVHAQSATRSLIDSARVYYEKKDFVKACYFYDIYYADKNNGQSNYDTYFWAVAACHVGETQKAAAYLKRSAEIGYDLTAYDKFASDEDNKCLRHLPEWNKFITDFKYKADSAANSDKKIMDALTDTATRVNSSLLTDASYWRDLARKNDASQLLKQIHTFNNYPTPGATGHWTLYHIQARDTLKAPYLVYIPKNYKPQNKTPLYIYLHGAVSGRPRFTPPHYIHHEEKVLQKAIEQNAFIIYPYARKDFNWLVHQDAFEAILAAIRTTKSLYNIDDDRVYIGGHSNGGTGAFWFALNKATTFASYYAMCQNPVSYTGNTPLINLSNKQRFIGLSAVKDETFNIDYVNDIVQYARQQGANWTNFTAAAGHGLPYSTPDSIYFLFDTLQTLRRDPAPRQLTWETEDVRNGQYFWMEITALDTFADKAAWHQELNPPVRSKEGQVSKLNFNKKRSGAVKASIKNNAVYVEISRVKAFDILLLPELFDIRKPVQLYVNNKLVWSGKVKPDKDLLLKTFLTTKDKNILPLCKISWVKEDNR
ncbi:MAG: hypothetical protein J7621_20680 [Niastella sp.]|nr:hypothetical protein [Niastella sp.]